VFDGGTKVEVLLEVNVSVKLDLGIGEARGKLRRL
jgi:hypothetical protein